ncbi:MAG: HAD-IA family hydrolase [Clostridia bacterium]|nr:HAD-IA family hydrolase [Clostridia bacterium]
MTKNAAEEKSRRTEMFDYLIYDFDGTISDSYPIFAEAFLITLKNHGIEETYTDVFAKLKMSVGYALNSYDWDCGRKLASREFHDLYYKMSAEKGEPLEGADEILRFAIERGKKNYIYTHSGEHATLLLKKFGFYDYFTGILDSTANFPNKPNPEALNWFIPEMGIDRDTALMIGDRDIDVLVGNNAGIKGCLIDDGGFYSTTKCDFRIEKLAELKSIIVG